MNKEIKTEIIINASRERIWKVLTDFEAYPQWNPFVVRIEGKPIIGTRLKNTLQNGEKQFQFKPIVTSVEPGKSFAWLGSLFIKGLFDGHHSFELEDLGNSQVKFIHSEQFSGILSGFILKKIGADTKLNFIKFNEAIKKRAEA